MPSGMLDKTWTGGKKGFDKVWGWADKLGAPVNKLSNKLGAEAFWPTTLDKECDKAARILKSFCKDGFYEETVQKGVDGPKQKQKVLKKIPSEVIAKAKGLAIFTTMRSGLWISGAGGSGILVARKADGTWSPPSGILLHTAGLGFLVGVDIYDCVVVINTEKALEAFMKIRCTLGGEISAVAGPVGIGGVVESEVHKRQAPVWTYLKSRGFYAGVQVDGTVIIERTDENARFYSQKVGVRDILAGNVNFTPYTTRMFMETLKAAQGDRNIDESILPSEPAPGDMEVEKQGHIFGVPDEGDEDPYGVLALEREGMEIREAGTNSRPTSEQFEYRPAPTSPVYATFNRRSTESSSQKYGEGSRRVSRMSAVSNDVGTQTAENEQELRSPVSRSSLKKDAGYADGLVTSPTVSISEQEELALEKQKTHDQPSPSKRAADDDDENNHKQENGHGPENENEMSTIPLDDERDHEHEHEHEQTAASHDDISTEAVPVQTAAQPQRISRARLVTIPKRIPPALPPRNPGRRMLNAEPTSSQEVSSSDASSPSATTPAIEAGASEAHENHETPTALPADEASAQSETPTSTSATLPGSFADDDDEEDEAGFQRVSIIANHRSSQSAPAPADSNVNANHEAEAAKEESAPLTTTESSSASAKAPANNNTLEGDEFHSLPPSPDRPASPAAPILESHAAFNHDSHNGVAEAKTENGSAKKDTEDKEDFS
ncbi:DUF500-domain-containing protein [Xylona heveae TC161]|uniref:DUF500-domain-containing protein n=1 Tax=Xylona heveae (strain CBS 132557 / TC161) TaxID=1328760 RepID=A0A165H024_XYLHT|nr:DUF500-domain-containing protein [Xylona heveae TC161]KZF22818.1 DUF500-domain-containing protein [Xylona heveae TC161]